MNNKKYTKEDIGRVCPIYSCRGKLKKINNNNNGFVKYQCEKCNKTILMDNNGCGTYCSNKDCECKKNE